MGADTSSSRPDPTAGRRRRRTPAGDRAAADAPPDGGTRSDGPDAADKAGRPAPASHPIPIRHLPRLLWLPLLSSLNQVRRNRQVSLSVLAVVMGLAGGCGAIGFRYLIDGFQILLLGFGSEQVLSLIGGVPDWRILLAPAVGGLLVGLLRWWLIPHQGPGGPAHAIRASALRGGRMRLRDGAHSSIINALSIGCGGSVGREGPAVHIGATLGSTLGRLLKLDRATTRTLLGCGVAAAVAASFNAPLAGTLFALEVVIGSYALTSFMPIVLAAVTGTVITRLQYGDNPAFILPPYRIESFLEFPAFALLGVLSAVTAMALMASIEVMRDQVAPRLPVPLWVKPGLAGLLVGAMALVYPQVLGVGYETTDMALAGRYAFWTLIALIVAKTAATALCLGGGFGGGLFSPSLCIGALLGSAFGTVATGLLPHLSSGEGAYAIVGMGAVAAAVLGAPISTILMIFELYGDLDIAIAVMCAVVIASAITTQTYGQSFFHRQLKAMGVDLGENLESYHMRTRTVDLVMRRDVETVTPDVHPDEILSHLQRAPTAILYVVDDDRRLRGAINLRDLSACVHDNEFDPIVTALELAHTEKVMVTPGTPLVRALTLMQQHTLTQLPVVDSDGDRHLLGFVREIDVLRAYNRATREARALERGEA